MYFFALLGCKKTQDFETIDPQNNFPDNDGYVRNQVLISEILPDPKQEGVEFIEIYNHSDQIIDLQSLEITTVNASGKRNRLHRVSDESVYLYPGTYKVLSKNSEIVQNHYLHQDPRAFHSMESFPTLTNTQGAVLLFRNEELIDSLFYNEKMHDVFIKSPKGVSFERVDFDVATNLKGNFVSSAATHGYATPGYQNSQAINRDPKSYGISLFSKKFAPDRDETLELHIGFERGAKMANVLIYNSKGLQVKKLLTSHRLGTRNVIHWDGKDDYDRPLPAGVYYVYAELYDSVGQTKSFKEACLLIR